MRDNKRITLTGLCLLALIWAVQPLSMHAQSKGPELNLDSLFNAFVKMKGGAVALAPGRTGEISSAREEIPGKCGTYLVSEVRRNLNSFSAGQRIILRKLLDDRPVLAASIVSPSGFFRIHFNTQGDSIPRYDAQLSLMENINRVAMALDSAYNFEVNYLGFPPPPSDNGEGGDNLYDVYITDIPDYGYTQTSGTPLDPQGLTSYSFMVIDDDFSAAERYYSSGLKGMYVTAAHEFNHAIQLGHYNALMNKKDLFFYEGSATAMEEIVFDTMNDYYQYLSNYFNHPGKPFYSYSPNESYTAVLWMLFQYYNYGKDIIRNEWENFKQGSSLKAVNTGLAMHGSSIKQALNTFGIWSFFSNYRSKADKYFKEAKNYPLLRPDESLNLTSSEQMIELFTDPVSNRFTRYLADNRTTIDTVLVILTNGDVQSAITNIENSPEQPDITQEARLTLYNYEAPGSRKVANNYYTAINAVLPDIFLESDIFNNTVANGGNYTISPADFAFPLPFNYGKNQYVYLPVMPNKLNSAGLSIFTSSMDLVFSGSKNIMPMYDSYTVQWDAMDSKGRRLPSGVYFYVTDSEGNLKKGKIVIQNE